VTQLAVHGGTPLLDRPLSSFWPPVDDETERKLVELYRSRKWTAFDEVEPEFAEAFARYHDATHGIFMINGTVTLQCALGAYGIGPGDEVIVPALTWYATAMAVVYLGATPVFVDVDPETLCIDPVKVEQAITERTRAIVPVHLYSSLADLDALMGLARRHDLVLVEDCAHVHGATFDGRGVGSIGHVGSFSFQQGKTMASAEGGACITSDPDVADRIFRMKQIGYGPGQFPFDGKAGPPPGLVCYPFRATGFQAVILHEQLRGLDELLERYARSAQYLEDRLSRTTRIRFQEPGSKVARRSWFGWVMLFDDPAFDGVTVSSLRGAMAAEGLPLSPTWGPVWEFNLFNLPPGAYRVDHPCIVTEAVTPRLLWLLHAYLGLGEEGVEAIAEVIEKVCDNVDALR
jgi:dTDP-4-amino-4,6-dideoxygalactose transaminase